MTDFPFEAPPPYSPAAPARAAPPDTAGNPFGGASKPALVDVYLAGQVRRWHANPVMASHVQTTADHQGRCVQLLLLLNPNASAALIRALAFHDVGELYAGDLAGPFKRAHPDVAAAHAAIETEARERLCGPDPDLSLEEAKWLQLIDGLEAAAFVILSAPQHVRRTVSGWPAAIDRIKGRARLLGVGRQVIEFLDGLFGDDQ